MKATAKKRKNGVYRVILSLMMVVLLATGCEQNSPLPPEENGDNPSVGLEDGFQSSYGDDALPYFCAYRSDKTVFDIDAVTLDFYYGGSYYSNLEHYLETVANIPSFDVYLSNRKHVSILVKHVEENFVSEKYRCKLIYDENWNFIEKQFNYSETITIPKEIFTEESGVICFSISGANVRETEPQIRSLTWIDIQYEVMDDKVVLSSQRVE